MKKNICILSKPVHSMKIYRNCRSGHEEMEALAQINIGLIAILSNIKVGNYKADTNCGFSNLYDRVPSHSIYESQAYY